jgi:AAA+ superfamily predicted ATPase
MDEQHAVIASLRNAVAALPADLALRLHLASLLLGAGHRDEAITHLAAVLQADPANAEALRMLVSVQPTAASAGDDEPAATPPSPGEPGTTIPAAESPGSHLAAVTQPPAAPATPGRPEFNWAEAEAELLDVLPPMFVTPDGTAEPSRATRPLDATAESASYDAERTGLRLADVAGMAAVKERLEAAFLAPLRNPDLRKLYGKSLRGGLLLYGPPGCGKTFIARAIAGELGARFVAVSFADVVDMYIGSSERNIREIFATAREHSPCVIFLDEVDALGQKRSQLRSTPMRSTVNQLLLELDDVAGANEGVFVLAATNHPWDVDSALRRPGRLDRTLLVLPPDEQARAAVFRYHLRDRPVAGIQLASLATRTDGFSGADIAHVCESAAELALLDAVRTGQTRMIGQDDLLTAVGQVRPSLGPWFDSARNVALFANEGGSYDDLAAYLKQRKLL